MLLSFALATAMIGAARAAGVPEYPSVTTFAGSGQSGERDGTANQAAFMAPRGLAASSDGTLYVSDYAAQRIRRVDPAGNVTTFAGSERPQINPEYHAGGYRDGPAAQAAFNGPAGLALTADGALIVADSRNHCLRRVSSGVVMTFAGSPTRSVAADGGPAEAAFREPLGVAVARDGTIYVADYGVGLRSIDKSGRVTTLSHLHDFTSVDVHGRGADSAVIAFGDGGMLIVRISDGHSERIDSYDKGKVQGDTAFGFPHGGIALDDSTLLFTDIRSQTIREAHVRSRLVETFVASRIVAGSSSIDAANEGDTARDGTGTDARFAAPFDIVRLPSGDFAISDAEAHRIRRMSDYEHRWANDPLPRTRSPGEYRVAFIGTSFAWFDNDWTTSIEGQLEARLITEASSIGLRGTPRVYAFSFPGVSMSALIPFVHEELADGEVDAVILEVDSPYPLAYLPPDSNDTRGKIRSAVAVWRPKLIADFSQIAKVLREAHVPLLGIYHPLAYDYSAAESAAQELPNALLFDGQGEPEVFAAFKAAIPDIYDATPQFIAASAHGEPLFQAYVGHFAPLGRKLIANIAFDMLAARRPWIGKP